MTQHIPQFQKSFKHDPCCMPFIPFSSLPTPFKVRGLSPHLVASVATWLALATQTGTEVRRATALSLALEEICPGFTLFPTPESSWSLDVVAGKGSAVWGGQLIK